MSKSTGLLYPSAVSQIVSPEAAWSSESKAAASDGESATTTLSVLLPLSRQLRATAIDSAQLVDGGAAVGDLDPTDLPISVAGGVLTYGGKRELWGLSPKPRDLDGDFGFQVAAKRTLGSTVVVSVDSMALEVWHVPMGSWWRTRCRPQRGS